MAQAKNLKLLQMTAVELELVQVKHETLNLYFKAWLEDFVLLSIPIFLFGSTIVFYTGSSKAQSWLDQTKSKE